MSAKLYRTITASFCLCIALGVLLSALMCRDSLAQEAESPASAVELNGDTVEYSLDGNVITAKGNVIVEHPDATLTAEEIQFNRTTGIAYAKGNVRLVNEQGEISAEQLTFNFNNMTGDFHNARLVSQPYYGAARKVSRVSESKIVMEDGYVTTSDFDKPEYRVASSKIEVYPGDKIVAKHNRFKVGPVPLAYIPQYTQSLKEEEPRLQFTPGYDGDWGIFLLTAYRFFFNENFKGALHFDVRELLGLAYGLDVDYATQNFGKGVLRTYYTDQERLTTERVGEEPPPARDGEQRYKAEWRHRWQIDQKTSAIMQFYKLSDEDFLKDFFEREFDEDQTPPTFFVLTRAMPKGTLSVRTDKRVNRFVSSTERLPEIRYDLNNEEIADTNLYYTSKTLMSSLSDVRASPSDIRRDTNRIHTDQRISYPMKIAFFELNPFVGGEWTFYSRYRDRSEDENIRHYYKAGASLQTKFYRIFDVDTSLFGEEIERMRHIVTPSLNYEIAQDPSIDDSQIIQIDPIDSRTRKNSVNVALENKLQIKRDGKSIDFLRAIISSDYRLKEDPRGEGFKIVKADIDIRPASWLTMYFDSQYDLDRDKFDTANFDIYINSADKWRFGLGRRFHHAVDDQLTTHFRYIFNKLWKFSMLHRFNIDEAEFEEQQYVLTRDLHSWEVDFHINDDQEGSEFIMVFRLKAFPEIGFDFGTSFNERESGSEPIDRSQ